MPAPYSQDLRKRAVNAYLSGDATYEEVAERFAIGPATVNRWVSRQRTKGSLDPDPMGGDRHSKFDNAAEARLAAMVEEDIDATRDELVKKVRDELGLNVSGSAIQRALQRLGLTRKKRHSTHRSATPSE